MKNYDLDFELDTAVVEVAPDLENLEVTPTKQEQNFKSENYYGYDNVKVNAIPSEYIIPTEEINITENGTTDVKSYETANVQVPIPILGTKYIESNGTYRAEDDGIGGYSEVTVETSGVDLNDYFDREITSENMSNFKNSYIKQFPSITISNDVTSYRHLFGNWPYKEVNIRNLNSSNITDMAEMFFDARSVENLDLSMLDTSSVQDMSNMFSQMQEIRNINLSSFNTSNVINMSNMFAGTFNLQSLDLSNFDTSNVQYMDRIFQGCGISSLNLSSFNTSNVTNMAGMFAGVNNLQTLDLSNFNTSNVTDMSEMFRDRSTANNTYLNLNSFDTSNVINMVAMFAYNSYLETIEGNFDFSNCSMYQEIFYSCSNLINLPTFSNIGKKSIELSGSEGQYEFQLDLSQCPNLSHNSLMNVINGLYDLTGYNKQNLILGENINKLDQQELDIAINKNWNVS